MLAKLPFARSAVAFAALLAGIAHAAPVKIGLVETLSGPQASSV